MCHSAGPAQCARVGGVVGVDEQGRITWRAGSHVGRKQGRLTAGRDHDLVDGGGMAGLIDNASGDRVAQRLHAGDRRISGVARACAFMHVIQNERVGSDVMFANRQLDDRGACSYHFAGVQEDFPPVRTARQQAGYSRR